MKKYLIMTLMLLCGNAYALPQDWPCDKIELDFIEVLPSDYDDEEHLYRGNNGEYEITIKFYINPYNQLPDIGTAGFEGYIKNLKTGKEEHMEFGCNFTAPKEKMICTRVDEDEYLLTKYSEDEYRVELCGSYNRYIKLSECNKCACIIRCANSQRCGSDNKIACTREDENTIRCFSPHGYEHWRDYRNKIDDYKNCVNLNL